MTESVSDILVARQRQFDSVGRPVAFSLGVHVLVFLTLAVMPSAWFGSKAAVKTMTITLGAGSLGVKRSGQVSTGGKRVDEVVEPKDRTPILPVAPPKAVTPDPAAAVVKTPPRASDKPATAPTTTAAKPATGVKAAPGSALVETGAKGVEIGLSSSGGGNNSAEMDSCCKEYYQDLLNKLDAVWVRNQGVTAEVSVDFIIEKNGAITGIFVSKASPYANANLAAERAIYLLQNKLGPLPPLFTGQRMLMTLKFPYTR